MNLLEMDRRSRAAETLTTNPRSFSVSCHNSSYGSLSPPDILYRITFPTSSSLWSGDAGKKWNHQPIGAIGRFVGWLQRQTIWYSDHPLHDIPGEHSDSKSESLYFTVLRKMTPSSISHRVHQRHRHLNIDTVATDSPPLKVSSRLPQPRVQLDPILPTKVPGLPLYTYIYSVIIDYIHRRRREGPMTSLSNGQASYFVKTFVVID
jgi:hypothetical protein